MCLCWAQRWLSSSLLLSYLLDWLWVCQCLALEVADLLLQAVVGWCPVVVGCPQVEVGCCLVAVDWQQEVGGLLLLAEGGCCLVAADWLQEVADWLQEVVAPHLVEVGCSLEAADSRQAEVDWQQAVAGWQQAVADWQQAVADSLAVEAGSQQAVAGWQQAEADCLPAEADWQQAEAGWFLVREEGWQEPWWAPPWWWQALLLVPPWWWQAAVAAAWGAAGSRQTWLEEGKVVAGDVGAMAVEEAAKVAADCRAQQTCGQPHSRGNAHQGAHTEG